MCLVLIFSITKNTQSDIFSFFCNILLFLSVALPVHYLIITCVSSGLMKHVNIVKLLRSIAVILWSPISRCLCYKEKCMRQCQQDIAPIRRRTG